MWKKHNALAVHGLPTRSKLSKIAKHLNISIEELKQYNPHLRGIAWKKESTLPKGLVLKYPLTEATAVSLVNPDSDFRVGSWDDLYSLFGKVCGLNV